MKYSFRCLAEDSSVVTYTFDAVTVTEMCERFQQFLAGCGFIVAYGEIQLVQDMEESDRAPL